MAALPRFFGKGEHWFCPRLSKYRKRVPHAEPVGQKSPFLTLILFSAYIPNSAPDRGSCAAYGGAVCHTPGCGRLFPQILATISLV